MADNGVLKTQLDNGLTVVLKEMHHAPVASFWVWYNVGSRNEIPGITGSAHWVEHMMFKGTETMPGEQMDRAVSRIGGQRNAFTWMDYTAYYQTVPSAHIDLALDIESDRMVNTIMSEEATESERTVILSERHMYENRPTFLLFEELQATAFRVHPYHHETIGDEVDLISMNRDDLYEFYRRYYAPNNATIVAVGDFDSADLLGKIEAKFGGLDSAEPPTPITRIEPPQRGERQTTVRGPGDTTYLIYAYKAPNAEHPDYFPLALLNAAFSGGGSVGNFGGGTTNKSSRLYESLVSNELAVAVQGSMSPTKDPFLLNVIAVARPGVSIDDLEVAMDAEIDRLGTEPLTQKELDKAIKRTKVTFIRAGESITAQARMMGMAETVMGDYDWFNKAVDKLEQVTLEDIERVRAEYLRRDNRTVGRYLPV
ncbi:MAG: M16 family metallopeptidase [Candidatus Promineifilaceae bacterium]